MLRYIYIYLSGIYAPMCTTDDSNIYNFRSCCCCNNGKIICDYQQAGSRIYMYVYIWGNISHIPNPISTVECNVAKDKQTAVGKDNEKKLQAKCARVREFPVEQTHKQNAKEKPAKIIKIIIKKPPHTHNHTHTQAHSYSIEYIAQGSRTKSQ